MCQTDTTSRITELLRRLDTALGKALNENTVIDEVLPEIQRRR